MATYSIAPGCNEGMNICLDETIKLSEKTLSKKTNMPELPYGTTPNGVCESKKKGWLECHLEIFVKPYLGRVPLRVRFESGFGLSEFDLSVIKQTWKQVKRDAKDKTIVLPGRDVWIFEVLARRENYPTIFLPACSRATVKSGLFTIPKNSFILDTGFIGSIPKALNVSTFTLISSIEKNKQAFQQLKGSRNLALKIESLPKYWKCGHLDSNGQLFQEFSEPEEFSRAAQLTMALYTSSTPAFVVRPQEKKLWKDTKEKHAAELSAL